MDEIRASIGADSLGYISLDGMVEATEQKRDRLCTACFTGSYPIALPDSEHLGKHALEQPQLALGLEITPRETGHRDAEGVSTGIAGGAVDALTRP